MLHGAKFWWFFLGPMKFFCVRGEFIKRDIICHAPIALASAPNVNGKWLYDGYKMTTISRFTEWLNEDFFLTRVIPGHIKEYPTDVLRKRGGDMKIQKIPMIGHVVDDRELMKGQDPFSAGLMAKKFVEKLNRYTTK